MFSNQQALTTTRGLPLRPVGQKMTDSTRGTTPRLLRHLNPHPIQWLKRPAPTGKLQHHPNQIQLKVSTYTVDIEQFQNVL